MNDENEITITLPRKRSFKNVYQFKITLLDTDPPVWRRIQVPESYTFYDLHVAIQDAMGWMDYHLHDFEIPTDNEGEEPLRIECPFALDDIMDRGKELLLTTEVRMKRFLTHVNDSVLYHYDYGDGWEHEVILEDIIPKHVRVRYPICIEGELAGPPEDCGGIPGYYRCIEVLKKKDDEELLSWLGDWRPDDFNPKKVEFCSPRDRLEMALEPE